MNFPSLFVVTPVGVAIVHMLSTAILFHKRRLYVAFLFILDRVLGEIIHPCCHDWVHLQ